MMSATLGAVVVVKQPSCAGMDTSGANRNRRVGRGVETGAVDAQGRGSLGFIEADRTRAVAGDGEPPLASKTGD